MISITTGTVDFAVPSSTAVHELVAQSLDPLKHQHKKSDVALGQ